MSLPALAMNTTGCMTGEDCPNTPPGSVQSENSEGWSSWNTHLFHIPEQNAEWLGPSSSSRESLMKAKVLPVWSLPWKESPARPMWHHSTVCVLSVWHQTKSNRCPSIANGPTFPYRNRSIFTACHQCLCPMGPHEPANGLRKLIIQTEFHNSVSSQPSWYAACSQSPSSIRRAPELDLPGQSIPWHPNTMWQPDSVHAECRDLLVNHSSNYCLKT